MTTSDIIALLITGGLGLLLVVVSCILLSGRGASLLAGYLTASREARKRIDAKALCRFMGKTLLPIGIATPAVALGGVCHIGWLPPAYALLVVGLLLFAVIWANTGGRFRK